MDIVIYWRCNKPPTCNHKIFTTLLLAGLNVITLNSIHFATGQHFFCNQKSIIIYILGSEVRIDPVWIRTVVRIDPFWIRTVVRIDPILDPDRGPY